MRPNETHYQQHLGLRKVVPAEDVDDTTVDIIAIHGLDTESPRTWTFDKRDGSRAVNWLKDSDMLPAAIPSARVYTYDWNAKVFDNAPVQTLLNHADNLLALVTEERGASSRPIIFIASCFGGLILAEAICRAAQEGSRYRQILLSTVGIVFLATPLSGTDAAGPASWLVMVKGIMGKDASRQLIKDLEGRHDFVRERVQKFAEIANFDSIRLPVQCFFETRKTKIANRFFPAWFSNILSRGHILVTQSSACLHGFDRQSLERQHVMMNKFGRPDCRDFKLVKGAIQSILDKATETQKHRENSNKILDAKPTYFMVPFGRNGNFVGRESILQRLLKRIPPRANKDDCQRTALEGLGGIGKTQIALEAAYQVRDHHPECSVFWVPAVDAASFENAYRDIGRQLGVKGIDNDQDEVKTLVQAALSNESAGNWLLIIDNADDLELLFTDLALFDYLPFSRQGSILFTTRTHEATVKLDISQKDITIVTGMNEDEATNLLRAGLKESQICDGESTKNLLEFLANLPLAIKQASAYLARTGMSVQKYLQHCRSNDKTMVKLLSQDFEDRGRYKDMNNPVATTWLISFNHIDRDYPLAARYMRFICCLAEKDIPVSLLPPEEDGLRVDEAIGILKGYAFIMERSDPESFDIHRLVRLAMRNWLQTNKEWQEWTTNVFQHLAEEYPFPENENRSAWMRYLPHGQAVLELEDMSVDEKANIDLLIVLAQSYSLLGKYNEAERTYRNILYLEERLFGKEDPETISTMNSLALNLYYQGKYEEAEPLYQQKIEFYKRVYGEEHYQTLNGMNNLALVFYDQGKHKQAEKIHRQILDIRMRVVGKEDPDTLATMNNLAAILCFQKNYEEAEQMHRQILDLRTQVLGNEHPDTLASINNLALVLADQGKNKEAKQMHRYILNIRMRVLGKEHPDTLTSINNLALIFNNEKRYEKAERMWRETLDLNKQILGEENPTTLTSMGNLAGVLHNQEKFEEAERIYRQAIELQERILGEEHPSTLRTKGNLDLCLEAIVILKSEEKRSGSTRHFWRRWMSSKNSSTSAT
ncbi:uncharacterized protein GGS22DRAFT_90148 [Annulohypoxylon maeteangense]|uniref:uncharacterized protein n=1 Tax=Annulohypoxylon maeteangense TaxID=1927788 RepID=UPI002007F6DE|nr:uncharacterized protein GGS22DRAFT_90148 [Annulohypoxylon maeteangense]KAI0887873.1 hypothetical protein GGS22DRAFT_90148 [Annulohypoxylon maeteangense]